MRRTSIRLRLTALYAALFALSAGALLVIVYLAMRSSFPDRLTLVLQDALPSVDVVDPSAPVGESPIVGTTDLVEASTLGDLTSAAASKTLLQWSILAFAIMLVISVVLGWVVAGRALAPIHQMAGKASRISARHLSERFELTGPRDELRELADAFDAMLDRVESAFVSERRLIANVSHELRTPLATQRAILEVGFDVGDPALAHSPATQAEIEAMRSAGASALEQNERAARIIDAMLQMARIADKVDVESLEEIDLRDLVAHAVEEFDARAREEDIEVTTEVPMGVRVLANRALTERLVDNLLANAIAHNHHGGTVWVSTSTGGGRIGLQVANTGSVISERDAAQLVLPFRRGGPDRTGSRDGHGLGLSIVSAIAKAHDADLQLSPRPGGGLVVTVAWSDVP